MGDDGVLLPVAQSEFDPSQVPCIGCAILWDHISRFNIPSDWKWLKPCRGVQLQLYCIVIMSMWTRDEKGISEIVVYLIKVL